MHSLLFLTRSNFECQAKKRGGGGTLYAWHAAPSFFWKGEKMRKCKTIIMIVCMIMVLQIHALAAAIPALDMPFLPPAEVEIYDAIFNSYGVTAIDESDGEKRLRAYKDLFTRVLANGAQVFFEDMAEIVDSARETRKITISSSVGEQLAAGVKSAINTGVHLGGEVNNINRDVVQDMALEVFGYYLQESLVSQIISEWGVTPDYYMAMYKVSGQDMLVISSSITVDASKIYFAGPWRRINNVNSIMASASWFRYSSDGWQYYDDYDSIKGVLIGSVQLLHAKDSETQAAINADTNTIITPASQLTEQGKVDMTKPIVINIYKSISYPAISTEDIDEKQRELVVSNISTEIDGTQERADLQELAIAQYGNIQDYHLSLLDFFPFCIPKDIMLILQGFAADPVAPSITIPFPTWEDGELTHYDLYVSLEQFDSLAALMRRLECVVFLIGLLVVTRERYLRG